MTLKTRDVLDNLYATIMVLFVCFAFVCIFSLNHFTLAEAQEFHRTDNFFAQLMLLAREYIETCVMFLKSIVT